MASQTVTTEPLFAIDGTPYAVQYSATETGTHSNYSLQVQEADEQLPQVSSAVLPQYLTLESIVVIDSVNSGVGRENRDLYATVLQPLLAALSVNHTYIKTESKEHITEFGQNLNLSKSHTIIIISGDTSVYELANGLHLQSHPETDKHDINVLTIPFGSGNALALSSGITSEIDAIQKLFLSSSAPTELPLYSATFPEGSYYLDDTPLNTEDEYLFCVVLTFAMHAKLVWIAEQPDLKSMGVDRFKVAAGRVAATPLDFKISVSTSSSPSFARSIEHTYLNIFAVPCIERNYYISPNSHVNQSQLHMLRIDNIPPQDLMAIMIAPYSGPTTQHIHMPAVEYNPIDRNDEIVVEFQDDNEENSLACIDGIIVSVKNPKGKQIVIKPASDVKLGFNFKLIAMNPL